MQKLLIPSLFNINILQKQIKITKENNNFFFPFSFKKFFYRNSVLYFPKDSFSLGLRTTLLNFFLDLLSVVSIRMEIVGFNYRVKYDLKHHQLQFSLGYSNIIVVTLPKMVTVKILDKKNKLFELLSYDRRLLLPVAIRVRNLKAPNPYTGHGIRFYREKLKLKEIKK